MNIKKLETYLWYVDERETILNKRKAGLPQEQWTNDKILQERKFCNNRREDDSGTIWNKENIRVHWEHPEYFSLAIVSRLINYPKVMDPVMDAGFVKSDHIDEYLCKEVIKHNNEHNGLPLSNIAYRNGKDIEKGHMMVDHYVRRIQQARDLIPEWDRAIANQDNDEVWSVITQLPHFKAFIPQQIMIDIAHPPLMEWSNWKDDITFIGPGSTMGLQHIYDTTQNFMNAKDDADWNDKFIELQGILKSELNISLSLHDVQNTLCEYQKYQKNLGKKSPHMRKFNPTMKY